MDPRVQSITISHVKGVTDSIATEITAVVNAHGRQWTVGPLQAERNSEMNAATGLLAALIIEHAKAEVEGFRDALS